MAVATECLMYLHLLFLSLSDDYRRAANLIILEVLRADYANSGLFLALLNNSSVCGAVIARRLHLPGESFCYVSVRDSAYCLWISIRLQQQTKHARTHALHRTLLLHL